MKILLVTPMPPQPQATGAIPLVLYAQVTALMRRHQVTLVTAVGPGAHELEAVKCLAQLGVETHAVPLMHGGAVQRWQRRWQLASGWLSGRYPWRTLWFHAPALQRTLDHVLATEPFDVVQVEDNAMAAYHYRTQTPLVLTEHEVRRPRQLNWGKVAGRSNLPRMFDEMDWQRWPRYERSVWERFDCIQVFTQRDAEAIDEIAAQLSPRVRVNPFGVSPPVAANLEYEQQDQLIFMGDFTHAPNVDAALWLGEEIMPRLRSLRPGVHLNLVGVYPPEKVKALAGPDIAVTGPVPEIEPWIEQAAVVMAPLRIGGGMRMKVLHSMAMGKAVVTTPRGAEGLAIENNGPPLVVADDADAVAAATAALLADPVRRRALGSQARIFVLEHFSPDAYVRRLEAVYAELLPSPTEQQSGRQTSRPRVQEWEQA
jgi:polysaccharide biosynthesis protein PslH